MAARKRRSLEPSGQRFGDWPPPPMPETKPEPEPPDPVDADGELLETWPGLLPPVLLTGDEWRAARRHGRDQRRRRKRCRRP